MLSQAALQRCRQPLHHSKGVACRPSHQVTTSMRAVTSIVSQLGRHAQLAERQQAVRGIMTCTCAASAHPLEAPAGIATAPASGPIAATEPSRTVHQQPEQHHLHHQPAVPGGIELIMGSMFAGKSTELLKRVHAAERGGTRVLVLKSDKDTRYSAREVATHSGTRHACFAVHSLMAFKQSHAEEYGRAQVVAIDEGQFFSDLVLFVRTAADHDHKKVIIAGLDGDFKRERFGQLLDLIPMADEITKLKARCYVPGCKHHALFTQRTVADGRQELVGGADLYRPACRHHYLNPQ